MTDAQLKRKIVVTQPRLNVNYPSRPTSPTKSNIQPSSPLKRSPYDTNKTRSSPAEALPRPRAKVSTSANVSSMKKPVGSLTPGYASGSSTPRAPSPVRQLDHIKGRLSPKPSPQTLSRMRSRSALSAVSAPSSPRSFTSPRVAGSKSTDASIPVAKSENSLVDPHPPRVRHSSISSASALSSVSSARTNGVRSPASSVVSDARNSSPKSDVSTVRVKAKLTSLAKGKPSLNQSPLSPSPLQNPQPTTCFSPPTPNTLNTNVPHPMARTVSIGSSTSKRESIPYPITTATPAANAHRYASVRISSASYRSSQCFPSPLQAENKSARVDPTLIPLPPLSPPSSNLSFSSRSSASRSSASSSTSNAATPSFNLADDTHTSSSDLSTTTNGNSRHDRSRNGSLDFRDVNINFARERYGRMSEPLHDMNNEDITIRAEAKSHRKIADLEITTKSLLAINSQLEANKHKQAKEIRELRRKLRESRLILPPRVYRQLDSEKDESLVDEEESTDPEDIEVDRDEGDLEEEGARMGKDDEHFNRVRLIINGLLESGRHALASKVEDFAPPNGTAKVLHEVEARSWRDGRHGRDSGVRFSLDREFADDVSVDETFVTADSGDESFPSRRVSGTVKGADNGDQEKLIKDLRVSLNASLKS